MYFIRSRIFFLVLFAASALPNWGGAADDRQPAGDDRLVVMTYNVLCSFCDRKNFDPWEERLPYFRDIFQRHQPDLIGLQEITRGDEVRQIGSLNPEYGMIFFHDPADGRDYPDATIFYRLSRFDVVEQGNYWLSKTPDTPWTHGWAKVQFWRLVTWARLKQKSNGRELYFATTHFDNNRPNQEMSAPLVLERTKSWAENTPCIFVGDFNSRPSSIAYGTLTGSVGDGFKLINSFDLAKKWSVETNLDPKPEYNPDSRIDHIFLAGPSKFEVLSWTADLHGYGGLKRYPSDHFPLVAEIQF